MTECEFNYNDIDKKMSSTAAAHQHFATTHRESISVNLNFGQNKKTIFEKIKDIKKYLMASEDSSFYCFFSRNCERSSKGVRKRRRYNAGVVVRYIAQH